MNRRLAIVLVAATVATLAPAAGCEYVVRLDRGLVDAGGEASCPICSDGGEEDGGDAGTDAAGTDATHDAGSE
jgi:hypothetical protein